MGIRLWIILSIGKVHEVKLSFEDCLIVKKKCKAYDTSYVSFAYDLPK